METSGFAEEGKNVPQSPRVWDNPPLGSGVRMSAKGVLSEASHRVYRRLRALQILEVVVDWSKLSPEEEEILWSFFLTVER